MRNLFYVIEEAVTTAPLVLDPGVGFTSRRLKRKPTGVSDDLLSRPLTGQYFPRSSNFR